MSAKPTTGQSARPAVSTDELLMALIAASGLTDYALAKASGVDATQIGRFKRKERSITTETADKLFRGLGYVWPPMTIQVAATPEEAAFQKRQQEYRDAMRAAVSEEDLDKLKAVMATKGYEVRNGKLVKMKSPPVTPLTTETPTSEKPRAKPKKKA